MKLSLTKKKYSGLDGRTYVRFQEDNSSEARPFTIEASASGIRIKGTMQAELEDMKELQEFAKTMSDAWIQHILLRKDAIANISGQQAVMGVPRIII